MAKKTRPPGDFDVAQWCRRLEMASLKQVLRLLAGLLLQARRDGHPLAGEIKDTMRRLLARFRRLQAEEESSEEPEDYG